MHKNPHVEISKLIFKEINDMTGVAFQKRRVLQTKGVSYSIEAFRAALTADAASSKLGTMEDELVRDFFFQE